jgi:NTE family protein
LTLIFTGFLQQGGYNMKENITNLVFKGGGVLGIAYLGVLDYLFRSGKMKYITRTAGTSSGAIAACLTSLNLTFEAIKSASDLLDFKSIPFKGDFEAASLIDSSSAILLETTRDTIETVFGDMNCLYRLVTHYGWYSSEYFYHWIKDIIAAQFSNKKQPPYTFSDFQKTELHKDGRPFHDLYIIGSNLTTGNSQVFSYETTPNMEVAQAVRISISIPLFFEAVRITQADITGNSLENLYCDGGALNNYPIKLFDSYRYNTKLIRGANMQTLGVRFKSSNPVNRINNLLDYIWSIVLIYSHAQQDAYYNSPMDIIRSISIDPSGISPIDFNISPKDKAILYRQGFSAAESFFKNDFNVN